MANDGLMYDVMVERALRGVLREALTYIAESGLPGDHHFYITFRTDHPDVDIADVLHDRYPGEMTIVLQHQYWELEVGEDLFAVTLSFADVPQRLEIPFESVIAFADPSVRFRLQFDFSPGEEEAAAPLHSAEIATLPVGQDMAPTGKQSANPTDGPNAAKTKKRSTKKRSTKKRKSDDRLRAEPVADLGADDAEKIVTLDTFRKK